VLFRSLEYFFGKNLIRFSCVIDYVNRTVPFARCPVSAEFTRAFVLIRIIIFFTPSQEAGVPRLIGDAEWKVLEEEGENLVVLYNQDAGDSNYQYMEAQSGH